MGTHDWWQQEGVEDTIKAPVLLTIPLVLFQALRAEKKPLMPHEAYKTTMSIVNAALDVDKAKADWDLVLSWCLLAAQQNSGAIIATSAWQWKR